MLDDDHWHRQLAGQLGQQGLDHAKPAE